MPVASDAAIAKILPDLARKRGPGKTFCPSVACGQPLVATQSGRPVDALTSRRPIGPDA